MMTRVLFSASMLAALMCVAPAVFAGPMATLSSPANLNNLTVGELVTINVNLSGLPVGTDFIFNLDTKVLFPSSSFQTVPDPTNTSGLTTNYGAGFAFQYAGQPPAFYSTSSLNADNAVGIFNNTLTAPAISENGIYYSFTLEAIAPGSGSISFDPTPGANQYAADDTGFNYALLPTGGPLSFAITAVPEPSAFSLGIVATFVGLGCGWYRHRKQDA